MEMNSTPPAEAEEEEMPEAAAFEQPATHSRGVPLWLIAVYVIVAAWAVWFILAEVVPYFGPASLTASAPAAAPAVPGNADTLGSQALDVGTGNADNGAKLFQAQGCSACHSVQQGQKIVGPSLYHLKDQATEILKGSDYKGKAKTPEEYVHESIVSPNAYIVQGFPPGVMPQDYAKKLKSQDVNDLIAFLMTK